MKNLQLISLMAICLLLPISSFAQQTEEQNTLPKCGKFFATTILPCDANQDDVSENAGSWRVRIITSGGIMGGGKGNLTLTSKGKFSFSVNSLTQSELLTSETLQPLTQLIAKVQIPKQVGPFVSEVSQTSITSFCRDCYNMTFILSRRDPDGKLKTLESRWDVTTRAKVAEEVLQIYEILEKLTADKDKRAI
jgi:hypothetical protein